jgi:hypothetical protein
MIPLLKIMTIFALFNENWNYTQCDGFEKTLADAALAGYPPYT